MITLTEIVQDCCMEAGDDSYKLQYRMTKFCIRAFAELNTYVNPTNVSHLMPVHPNRTVDLRNDCLKVWKVGILVNGRIITMGIDNTLSDIIEDTCPCETVDEANARIEQLAIGTQLGTVPFGNVWAGNVPIGTFFGIGAGFNGLGYYKEDYANKRIILEPYFDSIKYPEIVIQQKVSGLGSSMNEVRDELRQPIIDFALSKHFMSTNPPLSDRYWRNWMDSRNLVKKLIYTHSLQQLHEDNLKNDVNAPKR